MTKPKLNKAQEKRFDKAIDKWPADEWSGDLFTKVKQHLAKELALQRKEIKKFKTYPDKPCPECGGKLKFGASDRFGMKYGCYNKECQRVKDYNYFFVYVTPEMEERNRTVDAILNKLK